MTDSIISKTIAIDSNELLTPQSCIKSAIVLDIKQPDRLGPSSFLPEGKTVQVPANSAYHIRTIDGWVEAIFYEPGSITGPVSMSEIDNLKRPSDIYQNFKSTKVFYTSAILFLVTAIGVILGTSQFNDAISKFGYVAHSFFPLSLAIVGFLAFVFAILNVYRFLEIEEKSDESIILKLRPMMEREFFFHPYIPHSVR